eukprot:TRINITY_DN7178_c1_g2_i1.p1 TRINITY_DN7178_c1_g2~~TRINITY_DN7178_c1_g2_i1.p1  ORF type:complete len:292 (+),score=45.98 TRINITY_DN7178_c1_g2_i1:395-1270(+)
MAKVDGFSVFDPSCRAKRLCVDVDLEQVASANRARITLALDEFSKIVKSFEIKSQLDFIVIPALANLLSLEEFMDIPASWTKEMGIRRMHYNADRSLFIQFSSEVHWQCIKCFDELLVEFLGQSVLAKRRYVLNKGRTSYKHTNEGGQANSCFSPDLTTPGAAPTLVLEVASAECHTQLKNCDVPFWLNKIGAKCVVLIMFASSASSGYDMSAEVYLYRSVTGSANPTQSQTIYNVKDTVAAAVAGSTFRLHLSDIFHGQPVPMAVTALHPSGWFDVDLADFLPVVQTFLP